ncbi:hypothetical protein LTR37_010302 [Vermiconidia calcicola]|uniref:Uncharacterized protein n=1 Tax=Vermiconidia calcicola TaxID=1690605 RepID=A0ACC3N876_9PEZI|nr:hypothetical protein LTR37_010302 [Vermiconidia calcicola]
MECSADKIEDAALPAQLKQINIQADGKPTEQQESNLLKLPAELRTSIYEWCLVEDIIPVTEQLKPPPLLHTCRQIRREALETWYLSNEFEFDIIDCDRTLFVKFHTYLDTLGLRTDSRTMLSLRCKGVDWSNLVKWCHGICDNDDGYIHWLTIENPLTEVLDAAMKIAKKSRGLPWTDCEAMLTSLRRVAGRADERWLR